MTYLLLISDFLSTFWFEVWFILSAISFFYFLRIQTYHFIKTGKIDTSDPDFTNEVCVWNDTNLMGCILRWLFTVACNLVSIWLLACLLSKGTYVIVVGTTVIFIAVYVRVVIRERRMQQTFDTLQGEDK